MLSFRLIIDGEPGMMWLINRPEHIPQRGDLFEHDGIEARVVDYRWSVFSPRAGVWQLRLDLLCVSEDIP